IPSRLSYGRYSTSQPQVSIILTLTARWCCARRRVEADAKVRRQPMAERFTNKAIIVTGAGNGMGRASALAFAREGGGVAVADVNQADGQETVRQIVDSGGRAIFVHCDISRSTDVQRLIAETVTAFGGVDVLHNNAGIVIYGTVVDMPE